MPVGAARNFDQPPVFQHRLLRPKLALNVLPKPVYRDETQEDQHPSQHHARRFAKRLTVLGDEPSCDGRAENDKIDQAVKGQGVHEVLDMHAQPITKGPPAAPTQSKIWNEGSGPAAWT